MSEIIGNAYRYGNYGGQNYSGGRNIPVGQAVNEKDLTVKPKDYIDSRFRKHDIRYALAQSKGGKEEDLRTADKVLMNDLDKAEGLGGMQQFNANLAKGAFAIKTQLPKDIYKYKPVRVDKKLIDSYRRELGFIPNINDKQKDLIYRNKRKIK